MYVWNTVWKTFPSDLQIDCCFMRISLALYHARSLLHFWYSKNFVISQPHSLEFYLENY